jgi:hypothetical protein
MISIATEFPVRPDVGRAEFVAHAVTWLRGTDYSTVLGTTDRELDGDWAHLKTNGGEELRLRELWHGETFQGVGFRHDFPDLEGRLWRTEAVLRIAAAAPGQGLVRLRTQCKAQDQTVRLLIPKKPYLIKALIADRWGGADGRLEVSDKPRWLTEDQGDVQLASDITGGQATTFLPVVYVSANDQKRWLPTTSQIDKLAFDLGGIAHVVVEPSRPFSYRLRELTQGSNVYGGNLAVSVPGRGIGRSFFLGWRTPSIDDLLAAVRDTAIALRTQMPAAGWDWTDLQEQAFRQVRERDHARLSAEETEALYVQEIENLGDRVRQLEAQLQQERESETQDPLEVLMRPVTDQVGPEIYAGEFGDRLLLAAKETLTLAEQIGLDRRSKVVLEAITRELKASGGLFEFRDELRRATKDPRRLATELTALLQRHGYRKKSDNKHIRLEAEDEYSGLDSLTLPKTPSDDRGLQNLRKQIERTLGISKLA